jgi:hypothetical protein
MREFRVSRLSSPASIACEPGSTLLGLEKTIRQGDNSGVGELMTPSE